MSQEQAPHSSDNSFFASSSFRVVIFAPETINETPAGPNIRAVALARELAKHFDTTLAIPNESDLFHDEDFSVRLWSRHSAGKWLPEYNLVISQGMQYSALTCLRLAHRGVVQVFDLYTPVLLEQQQARKLFGYHKAASLPYLRRLTNLILRHGNYFLCASQQQRDLWLGALYANGCLNDEAEMTASDRIGVVPFGHNGEKLRHTSQVLKGAHRGIGKDDHVLLWGGGLWDWFDPMTLLGAMAILREKRPDIKLFFMSTQRPEKQDVRPAMAQHAEKIARELGLMDRTVFFNGGWIPFEKRSNYLLESDLAVCTAPDSLENIFAFRTRLVDAIWARLPIIMTDGSALADFVRQHDLGFIVRPQDAVQLADRIERALEPEVQQRFRDNMNHCRDLLRWNVCAQELIQYCKTVSSHSPVVRPLPFWKMWWTYGNYKIASLIEK
ncbi:MAG: glycosyltransferase family 4 protein [Candidatus Sumerlaeota bacterium]